MKAKDILESKKRKLQAVIKRYKLLLLLTNKWSQATIRKQYEQYCKIMRGKPTFDLDNAYVEFKLKVFIFDNNQPFFTEDENQYIHDYLFALHKSIKEEQEVQRRK